MKEDPLASPQVQFTSCCDHINAQTEQLIYDKQKCIWLMTLEAGNARDRAGIWREASCCMVESKRVRET